MSVPALARGGLSTGSDRHRREEKRPSSSAGCWDLPQLHRYNSQRAKASGHVSKARKEDKWIHVTVFPFSDNVSYARGGSDKGLTLRNNGLGGQKQQIESSFCPDTKSHSEFRVSSVCVVLILRSGIEANIDCWLDNSTSVADGRMRPDHTKWHIICAK